MLPARAWGLAVAAHRVLAPPTAPGHRLYWMAGGCFASRDLPSAAGSFLVVGRHTHCDVVLPDDRSVALRHVLIRSFLLDDGCPMLSVLDLRTHDGFELSDGTRQRSIFARGPLVMAIGAYSLVALPSDTAPTDGLPAHVREPLAAHPYRAGPAHLAAYSVARPSFVSRITLMPAASDLAEWAGGLPDGPGSSWTYELTLRTQGRRARVRLSRADLEAGVLVGRSERCTDGGLRAVLSGAISRAHLLLLRERSGCMAYDVASTQGTFHADRPVRCVALSDWGTSLQLSRTDSVRLDFRVAI